MAINTTGLFAKVAWWVTKNWVLTCAIILVGAAVGAWARYEVVVNRLATEVGRRQTAEAKLDTLRVVFTDTIAKVVVYNRLATVNDSTVKSLRTQLKKAGQSAATTITTVAPKEVVATGTDVIPLPEKVTVDSQALKARYVLTDAPLELTHAIPGPPADIDITVNLTVIAPSDSQLPRLVAAWRVDVKPRKIGVTVDVGCRPDGTPDVLLSSPDWAPVETAKTNAEEGLCARPPSVIKQVLHATSIGLGVALGVLAGHLIWR